MSSVVLVPHLNGIEEPCENGLKSLEVAGIKIWRRRGCSAIDLARNQMTSEVLRQGFDSMLFIDADIGFYWKDAIDLINRPEPVVCGVYPLKGQPQFVCQFADGINEVVFGAGAPASYLLKYAATGFLRIKTSVLIKMRDELNLPLCNTAFGKGFWPFFQPMIIPMGDGHRYLGEDWSFSERCGQIGVPILADTRIRLGHWGYYGYTWEDMVARPKNQTCKVKV
jgi:hypothetical protein